MREPMSSLARHLRRMSGETTTGSAASDQIDADRLIRAADLIDLIQPETGSWTRHLRDSLDPLSPALLTKDTEMTILYHSCGQDALEVFRAEAEALAAEQFDEALASVLATNPEFTDVAANLRGEASIGTAYGSVYYGKCTYYWTFILRTADGSYPPGSRSPIKMLKVGRWNLDRIRQAIHDALLAMYGSQMRKTHREANADVLIAMGFAGSDMVCPSTDENRAAVSIRVGDLNISGNIKTEDALLFRDHILSLASSLGEDLKGKVPEYLRLKAEQ